MPVMTRPKDRWAEREREDASTPPSAGVRHAPHYATAGTGTRAHPYRAPSFSSDAFSAQARRDEVNADLFAYRGWRLLEQWHRDEPPKTDQRLARLHRNLVLMGTVGNVVWNSADLDEALRHTLDAARRQRFEMLVTEWKTETLIVSSVTEKWNHRAYQSIIAMGKPAIPLILERIAGGERLWALALLSISGENPAEATRTPEEAQRAWLDWGAERGWLNS